VGRAWLFMRWKLIRRRFSISAPRVIVRSHLPWPLRWAFYALMFGFSAAIALWAFEFGKNLAGLDKSAREELVRLRDDNAKLREERDKAQAVANTAESLLKTEKVAEERLATQLRQAEAERLALQADLGLMQKLLPAAGAANAADALSVRGLQAGMSPGGHLRVQGVVMQPAKAVPFSGRYDLAVSGTVDGKPWQLAPAPAAQPLQVRQVARVEAVVDCPPQAVVKTVVLRILDAQGAVRATQALHL